ncbi:MAG: radical SAM protein [Chloroflexia bacterium]
MQEALLYDRLEDQAVLCRLCPWACRMATGESGLCQVRENREGTLYSLNYGLISAAAVEPIERRGLYHLFPGSIILTLGGWGHNLRCRHRPAPPPLPREGEGRRYLDPERAVSFALERHCRGLAWAYQEPAVWLEYVLDTAKLARANGLYTLMVTGGFLNREALDLLGPYLDAWAVEVVAASPPPYEALCRSLPVEAILEGTAYVREAWRCHVEVHTPLLPGLNDGDEVLRELAGWIRDRLGPDTPWHLWRHEPAGEGDPFPPSPLEALKQAREIGRESGLRYVYIQAGEQVGLTPTSCPSCGHLLIRREGRFYIKAVGLTEDNRCAHCGQEIYLRRSIFK